jgi:hypothetical protein
VMYRGIVDVASRHRRRQPVAGFLP